MTDHERNVREWMIANGYAPDTNPATLPLSEFASLMRQLRTRIGEKQAIARNAARNATAPSTTARSKSSPSRSPKTPRE